MFKLITAILSLTFASANNEICEDHYYDKSPYLHKMTGKEYNEIIMQGDTFVTNKRHILLFKQESMYFCSTLKENFEMLVGDYPDDELMIHYIDAQEEEALKLGYWAYFVPTVYVIDNTDMRAYILPALEIVHDYDTFK
jgi:hypothetical protein